MTKLHRIIGCVVVLWHISGCATSIASKHVSFYQQVLFRAGEAGYSNFRIPAIVKSPDGELLAFCEGRGGDGDDFGNIDIVLKRSLDSGLTSGPLEVVLDNGEQQAGNPVPVFDLQDTQLANGPGHGIQLKNGRIVIPGNHTYGNNHEFDFSHVYFSDDHGKSWQMGGSASRHTNESMAVELASGNLMLNMRRIHNSPGPYRGVAISRDGGVSFGETYSDKSLVESQVQASVLRYTLAGPFAKNRLLFSNPASRSERKNMTIRISYDEGRTWPVARSLYTGHSAYSDIVITNDMDIGVLHEADSYQRILFSRFNLEWLSEGKDSLYSNN